MFSESPKLHPKASTFVSKNLITPKVFHFSYTIIQYIIYYIYNIYIYVCPCSIPNPRHVPWISWIIRESTETRHRNFFQQEFGVITWHETPSTQEEPTILASCVASLYISMFDRYIIYLYIFYVSVYVYASQINQSINESINQSINQIINVCSLHINFYPPQIHVPKPFCWSEQNLEKKKLRKQKKSPALRGSRCWEVDPEEGDVAQDLGGGRFPPWKWKGWGSWKMSFSTSTIFWGQRVWSCQGWEKNGALALFYSLFVANE